MFYRILREYQNSQAILAEKLVGGKLGKQQFVEQEAIIIKRKDECKERIIAINSHLVWKKNIGHYSFWFQLMCKWFFANVDFVDEPINVWVCRFRSIIYDSIVRFLALVTTMVTMVDHGNHRSNDRGNDRSNHRGYYDRYYNVNAWFLHLLPRILPYLMTIRCEMNQILLRTIKNHLKRHIFGEKMYYHPSNDRSNHRSNHDGYYDRYYDSYYDQPWLPS